MDKWLYLDEKQQVKLSQARTLIEDVNQSIDFSYKEKSIIVTILYSIEDALNKSKNDH